MLTASLLAMFVQTGDATGASMTAEAHEAAGPPAVACRMEYGGRDPSMGGPRSLRAHCPADAEAAVALQAAADMAMERVSLRGWGRWQYFELRGEVRFLFDAETGTYAAEPGQAFIRNYPEIPKRIMERGTGFACSTGFIVNADGSPLEPDIDCLVDGERPLHFVREAERSVRTATLATRYVPTGLRYCETDEYTITIDDSSPQSYVDRLARFCDEDE